MPPVFPNRLHLQATISTILASYGFQSYTRLNQL